MKNLTIFKKKKKKKNREFVTRQKNSWGWPLAEVAT